jgi:two-component system cell cycle sensor histidine kinase/response regulator CckA
VPPLPASPPRPEVPAGGPETARPDTASEAPLVGIWSWHVPSNEVTLSAHTYRIYGLDPDTFGGSFESCLKVIHPDDLETVQAVTLRALSEKRGFPVEFRVIGADGEERLVRADADVFLDAAGEVERMAGMVQDITHQRATDIRQRRLATAVEQVAEAVLITDPTGVIQFVNGAFERTTGYASDEVLGQRPEFLQHPTQGLSDREELRATLLAGQVWAGRLRGQRRDGSSFLVDATVSPVHDDRGAIVNYVAVQRDVTREVALEEQLQHFQKMEAVAMLAGGIAHDFNNLLISIIGHSDLLLLKSEHEPDLHRHAASIRNAGERARDLTSQLLAFGRKQVLQPQRLDLNGVLRDMRSLLLRVLDDDVALELRCAEEDAFIEADPGQTEQVILNLATNAREAMPAGGRVEISLSIEDLDAEAGELLGSPAPGRHVKLRVQDTGLGMSDEVRARIFEPFFTTKGMSLGTGLGLATVYSIVRQNGGGIRVQSEPGAGTLFEVCFPLHVERASASSPQAPRTYGISGTETILVAEDEPLVASIVKSTLRAHGFVVLFGENGERALEVAQNHDGPIQLLFTDVVMPKMDGVELAKALRALRPETQVLYSSGYSKSALSARGAAVDDADLLQKPYTPATLVGRIREKLDTPTNGQSLTGS